MSLSTLFACLLGQRSRNKRLKRPLRRPLSRWNRFVPRLEQLEDRLAPATNITVIAGAAGAGNLDHFLDATHGAIVVTDDPGDTAATLSVGALQGVGPGTSISIAADSTLTFNDVGALNLQTGAGVNAQFATNTGAINFANVLNTVATAGGSLTFSAGTNLTASNLNTNGGDVSLTAGTAGAGNLQFENILTNGSGNLTFQATNAAGGTITQAGGTSVASGQAIGATATGAISVNSLRGTTVGLTSNTGSIASSGANPVQASAQLTAAAATGITLNTLAATLEASNSTSGNISITQGAAPAQTLTLTGTGVSNQVAGGTVSITNLGASISVGSSSNGVQSNNGDITLAATDLQISAPINSGTARTTLTTSVAGRAINLGTNVPGSVGLTVAEVGEVTAGVLQIGSVSAGAISVTDAINTSAGPGFTSTLTLVNNGPITENLGDLIVQNLRISSAGPVTIGNAQVDTLAASVTGSFSFENPGIPLTIGVVDGVTGITTAGSDIHLIAADLDLEQQVTTGSSTAGVVTLEPFTANQTIDLGTNSSSDSGLTNAELNEVTAGVLRIGSSSFTGNITVSAAINPTHVGALSLITTGTGTITQGSGDTITVDSGTGGLAVQSRNTVTLNEQNDVGRLAAAITGPGNNFNYTDANGFAVSTVDGVAGISTTGANGDTSTLTAGGTVTQDSGASIISDSLGLLGAGPYFLTDSGNDVGTLAASVTNDVTYTDADDLMIGTGAGVNEVQTAAVTGGSGTFTLTLSGQTTGSLAFNATAAQVQTALNGLSSIGGVGGSVIVTGGPANYTIVFGGALSQTDVPQIIGTGSGGTSVVTATTTNGEPTTGVTSTSGAVSINTIAGSLTVLNNVSAATTVTLEAGSTAASPDDILTNSATISGPSGVTLTADRMALAAAGPAPITGMTGAGVSPIVVTSPNHGLASGNQVVISNSTGNTAANGTFTITRVDADHFSLNGSTGNGTYPPAGAVTSAVGTGASNVVVQVASTTGLANGDSIAISGVNGFAAVNGTFTISNLTLNSFTLNGTSTNAFIGSGTGGSYIGSAVWLLTGNVASAAGSGSSNVVVTVNSTTTGLANGDTVQINGNTYISGIPGHPGNTYVISAVTIGASTTTFQLNGTNTAAAGSAAGGTWTRLAVATAIVTNTGGGNVVTLKGFTSGRTIDLGGTGDPTGTLQISQAELNMITTDIVRVGDLGTGGSITVTAALTDATTGFTTLSLLTGLGAGISQNSGATLTFANLQAAGNTGVALNENNVVTTLAGATQSGAFSFTDSTSLTVDNVDTGLGFGFGSGIITDGQPVNLTVNVLNDSLTVNQPIDTTHNFGSPAPGGAQVILTADDMAINAPINASSSGDVVLAPFTSSRTTDLGTNSAGNLGLTDAELDQVTARVLQIGDSVNGYAGNVTVTAAISQANSGYTALQIATRGAVLNGGGSIAGANLNVFAGTGIGTTGTPLVTAVSNFDFGNSLSGVANISNTGALTIQDGVVSGIPAFNNGTTTTLTATGPITFATNTTSVGTLTATTTEGAEPPQSAVEEDVIVNANVTVESTGGDVNFTSSDSIVTQAASLIKSDSGIVSLISGIGDVNNDAVLTLNGVISAANLTLSSPGDIVLGSESVTATLTATSTGGSIRDDGVDTTFIEAANISLSAANAIGGDTAIAPNDILTQDSVFKQAIDFDLEGGTLTLSQTGAGGNVQLRDVDGTFNSAVFTGGTYPTPVGIGNQLALIASGGAIATTTAGDLVVDAALTLLAAANVNLLLAATDANNVQVNAVVTNNATSSPTALVVGGSGAIGNPGAIAGTAELLARSINLVTGEGAIGTSALPMQISGLAGQPVTLNGDSTNNGSAAGGNIFVTDFGTGGVVVGLLKAGTGNVTLNELLATITSVTPNDGVADVIGTTVNLTATGASNGATGQIGFFTTAAQFFEVSATTINASTNNSRQWISAIGGAAIGSIAAGTDFAVVQTVNGDLTSTHTGANVTTPDVLGGTVLLLSTGTTGSFGSAANPLQVQTSNLSASVSGTTGSINVRNVAAGGDLNVTKATTINAAINLTVAGGNLTTTGASGTIISAPGNTVTLNASGAIVSSTTGTATDVGAASLVVTGATGVGTAANPLKTAVGTFAASVGNGGVFVTNTGDLTIGSVGGVNGVTATGGAVTIATSGNLTIANAVATSGAPATLSGNGIIKINATIDGSTATVNGGSGADVITVTTTGATPLAVNGQGGSDTFIVGSAANSLSAIVSDLTLTGGGVSDDLTLNDQGDTSARTYAISATEVDRSGAGHVLYSGMTTLTVNGSQGNDTYSITSKSATTLTGIYGGPGTDSFNVTVTATSGYSGFLVDGGAGLSNVLAVADVSGGGVLHVGSSSGTTNVVTADYTETPGALSSRVVFQNIASVTINPDAKTGYVQALFHQIFLRNASTTELTSFTNFLNGNGALALTTLLENTPEAEAIVINRYSEDLFNVPATTAQIQLGQQKLQSGFTEEAMLNALFGNAITLNVHDLRVQELSADFLRLLGRTPAQFEVDAFVNLDLRTFREQLEAGDEFFNKGI